MRVYTYRDLPRMKARRYAAKYQKSTDARERAHYLRRANMTYWQLYRDGYWCGRSGVVSRTAIIDCQGKSDLAWLLHSCSSRCITDPAQSCCRVPNVVASYFPCCRTKKCCTNQGGYEMNGGRRRRLGGASVAVSATVAVQASEATVSKYERLLTCLYAAGKVDNINATIAACEHQTVVAA